MRERFKFLLLAPVIFSILYIYALFRIFSPDWDGLLKLAPNEIGDFVSGCLGPLSIIWLIFGYFLQSVELRHSSEALHLQASELKKSVFQQQILAETAKSQLEEERVRLSKQEISRKIRIQPKFVVELVASPGMDENPLLNLELTNVGGAVSKLTVMLRKGPFVIFIRQEDYISRAWRSENYRFYLDAKNARIITPIEMEISYSDADFDEKMIKFELFIPKSKDGFGNFIVKEI